MKSAALAAALFFSAFRCFAQDSASVREAHSIDGKIACNAYHTGLLGTVSVPCEGFKPPAAFVVGATFGADGKQRTIRVIHAHQASEDLDGFGAETKKGKWFCVGAETEADLDQEHNDHALWLFVPRCQVVDIPSATDRLIEPFTPQQFLKLPTNIQAVYIGGLLEGMSYAYYGDSQPDYPKFIACVRPRTLGETTQDVVAFLTEQPDFDEGVSAALAKALGSRCKH
jgi:hypothetical protein